MNQEISIFMIVLILVILVMSVLVSTPAYLIAVPCITLLVNEFIAKLILYKNKFKEQEEILDELKRNVNMLDNKTKEHDKILLRNTNGLR